MAIRKVVFVTSVRNGVKIEKDKMFWKKTKIVSVQKKNLMKNISSKGC